MRLESDMKQMRLFAVLGLALLLNACGSSHSVTYSGHEESTEGVPGFVNGKKTSPYNKLGQSYTVDGETYVPHNQPDYVEEGMASWYGPGFHGGKTANGESYDSNELTAAHRTLPLPSIVKVTLLSTGKSAYVRVNDRGPFAHSRIIDLSRGAAEKIGLLRVGVGKVRIEYMKKESERFAELLANGRDPKSIDLASEVIGSGGETQVAGNDTVPTAEASAPAHAQHAQSFWDSVSPDANAAEPVAVAANAPEPTGEIVPVPQETNQAAPVGDIASSELNAPSPFNVMASNAGAKAAAKPMQLASLSPAPAPVAAHAVGGTYVQLGAFGNEQNANRLRDKFSSLGPVNILRKESANGTALYHVRMGPYADAGAAQSALDQAQTAGIQAKIIKE